MIVVVCLIVVGARLLLLDGRYSRAAMLQQQEGKASLDGLWQDVAESSIPTGSSDQMQREVHKPSLAQARIPAKSLHCRSGV